MNNLILNNSLILFITLLFIPMFMGCTTDKNEVVHPVLDRLPNSDQLDHKLNILEKKPEPFEQLTYIDKLEVTRVIGKDASVDSPEYYDTVLKKADIDSKSNIYLTQAHTNSITVYDKDGKYIYSIGRGGRGPGEFLKLITFSFDQNFQTLYVLDFFEIEKFVFNGEKFEYSKTIPHKFIQVFDMCTLDNNLYISGYKFSKNDTTKYNSDLQRRIQAKVTPPITRFNTNDLNPETSFGYEYHSQFGYGSHEGVMSGMLLSCNETTNTIVGYQKNFPFIFGYDSTGNNKWVSRIDGIKTPQFIEFKDTKDGAVGLMHNTQKGKYFDKNPIASINLNEYEILQLHETGPVQNMGNFDPDLVQRELNYKTILIDTETGRLSYSDNYNRFEYLNNNSMILSERDPKTFQRKFFIYSH